MSCHDVALKAVPFRRGCGIVSTKIIRREGASRNSMGTSGLSSSKLLHSREKSASFVWRTVHHTFSVKMTNSAKAAEPPGVWQNNSLTFSFNIQVSSTLVPPLPSAQANNYYSFTSILFLYFISSLFFPNIPLTKNSSPVLEYLINEGKSNYSSLHKSDACKQQFYKTCISWKLIPLVLRWHGFHCVPTPFKCLLFCREF